MPGSGACTLSSTTSATASPASLLARGATLGRYVILECIGQGGMGTAYSAYDFGLDRKVCLKVVRGSDPSREERLLFEARALAKVAHPNVVTVHDVGAAPGQVFIALELAEGGSLSEWLRTPRRRAEILGIFRQAALGLERAHQAGLVHRDFKPDNVVVDRHGRAKVTDFGLAIAWEAGGDAEVRGPSYSGTPAYMAPEQHRGEQATPASDQFAFAVALYEALTGARPFQGLTAQALARAKEERRIEPLPPGISLPGWIVKALRRALSPDPADRFESMRALGDALSMARARRRAGLHAVATGAVAAAVVLMARAPAPAMTDLAPRCEFSSQAPAARPHQLPAAPRPPGRPLPVSAAPLDRAQPAPGERAAIPAASWSGSSRGEEAAAAKLPASTRPAPARARPQRPTPLAAVLVEVADFLRDLGVLAEGEGVASRWDDRSPPSGYARVADPESARALHLFGRTPTASGTGLGWTAALALATAESEQVAVRQTRIHALEVAVAGATDPLESARARFELAQELWNTDPKRALTLAREAQLALIADPADAALLSDVNSWLEVRKPARHAERPL